MLELKARLVGDFIARPERRNKRCVAALGEFLPLITLPIRFGWNDLRDAYLNECYDRNARWIIGLHPRLAAREPDASVDARRPEQSFEGCAVSLKLSLFHVYFLENIARPAGVSTEAVKRMYDSNFGKPSQELRERWRVAMAAISQMASWDEYFALLGGPAPTRPELVAMLRRAVNNSYLKGYHGNANKPRADRRGSYTSKRR